LYALAKGMSRNVIIRDIIEEWLARQDEERDIIDAVIERLKRQWKIHKLAQPTDPVQSHKEFIAYLEGLEDELRKKGVEELHIEMIINGMTRDGKN
jgi:SOS response regulatory protein OraA/RecX